MTIEDLAKQLIECRGLELYRLLQILKEMRTDEARARVRAREREYAAKQAWRNCNAKFAVNVQNKNNNDYEKILYSNIWLSDECL
ncbi:MAG: hypothetical protein IJO18_02215 [Alphaproteobacteria bacterium]|nr:hypothetical protein [Alphaproteobacteria bacterium]